MKNQTNKQAASTYQKSTTTKHTGSHPHSEAFSLPAGEIGSGTATSKQTTDLDNLITFAEGHAARAIKIFGEVLPTIMVRLTDGSTHAFAMLFKNDSDKRTFVTISRLIGIAHDVSCMVSICESWMTMLKPGETPTMAARPSESPDRKECVTLQGETYERHTMKLLPITRTGAGEFFGFGQVMGPDFDRIQGRFVGMLPPKRPTWDTRRKALAQLTAMGITLESLQTQPGDN